MPTIGAAYLRCSDPKQDKSIDQQRVEIERRAAADGVVIPAENWFIDEGISGRSTKKRSSYRRLIRQAEAQQGAMKRRRLPAHPPMERLYVWAFSRIARNMFDCLRAIATLDDADIEIVSLTEHEVGDKSMRKLIRPILAWLAERYSEELSQNVQRGMASQAAKGFWAYGTVSFGYEAVEVEGGNKLVVTDATREDFEVVKRIFRMADEGNDGARRIAQRLTREGVRPPSEANHPREVAPGTWRGRHVNYILKNPVYCGHIVNKGEIVYRDAHEAAVDDETFARVQAKRSLRARVRQEGGGNGANPLLVGRHGVLTPFLRCGSCGGRITLVASSRKGEKTWRYFCGTRRDNKHACAGISVLVDKLDTLVLETIERQVLAPENVQVLLEETLDALAHTDEDHAAAERERLSAQVAELDRKIRLAATHAINGMIDEDDAKAITAPLIAQRETARLQLNALPARQAVPTVNQVNPDLFRQAVLEAWTQRPLDERREALAKVLDRITLDPGGVHIRYDAAGFCGHDRSSSPLRSKTSMNWYSNSAMPSGRWKTEWYSWPIQRTPSSWFSRRSSSAQPSTTMEMGHSIGASSASGALRNRVQPVDASRRARGMRVRMGTPPGPQISQEPCRKGRNLRHSGSRRHLWAASPARWKIGAALGQLHRASQTPPRGRPRRSSTAPRPQRPPPICTNNDGPPLPQRVASTGGSPRRPPETPCAPVAPSPSCSC